MFRSIALATGTLLVVSGLVRGQSFVSGGSDSCATATPISGNGPFLGDNIGATYSGFPPCFPHAGADVWYDWTATVTGATYVTLCNPGTLFNTKLVVYDTSACVGSMLACNDDTEPSTADCSTVAFYAVAGSVYKIYISGSPGAASTYEMTMTQSISSFCFPGAGGVVSCPCGNPPSGPGRGCNNFGSMTGGATLAGSGVPALFPDQFYLTATGENATALNIFFTGTATNSPPGVHHAAGVRCVTNNLKRLYSGNASGGMIIRPSGASPSVSARSAALGTPITPGQMRYYFNVYRDPLAAGPCGSTASGLNLTNAVSAIWAP
ncbi:MAG: hypothetical protein ACKVXR_00215 [Planctomycetota bacterium]